VSFSFFLAWRYVFTSRRHVFTTLISFLSILGIGIGVAALLITLSVMNGFHTDLREKILSTYSDLVLLLPQKTARSEWEEYKKKIERIDGVVGAAPYLAQEVLLKKDSFSQGCMVKGIRLEESLKTSGIQKQVRKGDLHSLERGEIIIGEYLARQLGAYLDDEVYLLSIGENLMALVPQVYKLKLGGIFSSGMYDYDKSLAYMDLEKAQVFFEKEVTGIEIKIRDLDSADRIAEQISSAVPVGWVRTWKETNYNLYAALKLEKTVMFIILSLIVLVAIFNIASSLIMLTLEKTRDIGLLKAIGAPDGQVYGIFVLQGLMKGLIGVALGNFLAVTVNLLLKKYQFVQLPPSVYYLNYLPVRMEIFDFLSVSGGAVFLSFLATLFPAKKAAGLPAASALRYE